MNLNFKNLYQYFQQHPQGRWIMKYENAKQLYDFTKTYPIKRVLDLGTGIGCSASIMALALKEKNVEYHIDSIEQRDKCVKLATELIPKELMENIVIHKSNAILWHIEKIPYQYFSIYETLPEGDYDFILNDGPAPWQEGENCIELPNATIIKMLLEDKLKSGTLIGWDGRISALNALERYFGGNFYLVESGQGTHFNIIERKDNPVKFEDERLVGMTTVGYFEE